MKSTPEQREQIDFFFGNIQHNIQNIVLYPIIDKKTSAERLGICIVDRSNGDNNIYLLGILFLWEDKLQNRFEFKEFGSDIIKERPANFAKKLWIRIKNIISLLPV